MTLWPQTFRGVSSRIPNSHDDDAGAIAGCPGARSRVILGLGLLVALVIAGHWMDAGSYDMVWRDAERIHLIERQGIGAERIAKLALHLQATGPGPARDRLLWELEQFLTHWDRSYDRLRDGFVESLATSHSREVESIYCELNSMQWGLLRSGRELVHAIRRPQTGPLHMDPYVADVLRFERENLQGIERLALQYRRDARERIALAQIYSRIWLTLVVAALAASGWWVLRGERLKRMLARSSCLTRPLNSRRWSASTEPAVCRAASPAAQQMSRQLLIAPAESPSQQNCEESDFFACSATHNR